MAFDLVLRNARVADRPAAAPLADIGIRDGIIAAIEPGLGEGAEELDLDGRLLSPGLVEDRRGYSHVEVLSARGDMREAAAQLFAALRSFDRGGYRKIYAIRVEKSGLGRAIMDRLERASAR